jgi:hypothetical protein
MDVLARCLSAAISAETTPRGKRETRSRFLNHPVLQPRNHIPWTFRNLRLLASGSTTKNTGQGFSIMRFALLAALAATLCHASIAVAEDRPSHDPAIEAAALAILQKKLPEIRTTHDIGRDPVIVRAAWPDAEPQGIAALVEIGSLKNFAGRIIWL